MHCKWIRTILFSGFISGCSLSKFCTIHIFLRPSEKFWYQLYRFPPTWRQGGFPFLDLKRCSFSTQAQFHTNSFSDFVLFWIANFCGSHFIFLMVVNSHYDCLSLRVLLSYFQRCLRKIHSRWNHLSLLLLSLEQIRLSKFFIVHWVHIIVSSTTEELSTDCT